MVYACLVWGVCTWYIHVWLEVCVHGICMLGWGSVYAGHVLRVVEME